MFPSIEAEVVGLVVYFDIYVYLLMWTWLTYQKRLFICSFVRKNVRSFHFPFRSHSIHVSNRFRYVMLLLG